MLDSDNFFDGPETTPLIEACSSGDVATARALLDAGANPSRYNWIGVGPLFVACRDDKPECVKLLLEHGADLRGGDDGVGHRMSPLRVACAHAKAECLALLLDYGVDISENDPLQAVCVASMHGKPDERVLACTKLLCAFGVLRTMEDDMEDWDFEMPDVMSTYIREEAKRYVTPLHYFDVLTATQVRNLLRAGADVTATTDGLGRNGPSPLTMAETLLATPGGENNEGANLLVRAYGGWTPESHDLFPERARKRAWELFRLGRIHDRLPEELWRVVMSFAITRDTTPFILANPAFLAWLHSSSYVAWISVPAGSHDSSTGEEEEEEEEESESDIP